jgi:antitoxin component YwqK of YwqJK toxin-antitoxin module
MTPKPLKLYFQYLLLLSFAFPVFNTAAQQIPYVNSRELISKGIEEHDKGNYKKAIELYAKVPEGDTNYLLSLYEQSLSYMLDSNFTEAITLGKKAVRLRYEDRRSLLLNMAAAYDGLGKEEDALKLYDSVSHMYPNDNRPYYERAVILFRKENYAEAEANLKQSITRNPYHFRSHSMLGNLYAIQGKLTQSIIALQASLLCTNEIQLANTPISVLSSIAQQTDEIARFYNEKKPENAHPLFDEIDEIVHAKLALNKGYQLKTQIDDNIVRQLQVVMEKLEYDNKDTSFVMQYYVPLLKEIYNKDLFEPYVLLLFSEYGIKSIDNLADARKQKSRIEEVKKVVFPYLNKAAATRVLNFEQRQKATEKYHLFPKDNMLVVGIFADRENRKFAEGFVQYFENQSLVAEGNYNAKGEKNGDWKYYYPLGNQRLKEKYKDGKLTGETVSYFRNGNINEYGRFELGENPVEQKGYTYDGYQESFSKQVGNGEYFLTYYHPDGSVLRTLTLVNDKIKDGKYTILYPNGKTHKEMSYRDQKPVGLYKVYYDNGTLKEEYTLKDEMPDGHYSSYYRNGKPETKQHFINGKKNGQTEDYYENGTLSNTMNMKNGKADGMASYYDQDGKLYGTINYDNDVAIAVKFVDKEGKTVYEQSDRKGLNPVEMYNQYGTLKTRLPQDPEGKAQGKASYYYPSGVLREESEFKDDKLDGQTLAYHKNGNLNMEKQYKEGDAEGYYKTYYSGGQLRTEGWIKNGTGQGIWRNYHINGKVQREFYLRDDELNGPEKNYENDGRLDYINMYDQGMLVGLAQYDTTGKTLQDKTFDKGNGTYSILYFNGNRGFEVELKNGKFNGPYTILSPDKKLLEKGNYLRGKKEGESITYYTNGQVRLKGTYKNGERDGLWVIYNEVGDIENETNYREGLMDGKDKFYTGGLLRYETEYHDDKKNGKVILYGESGKIAGVLYYDEGYLTGYSYEGKEGKLRPSTPVIKGTAIIKTTYADGAKAMEFNFVNNCYEGSQKIYFSNGTLAEDRMFHKDDFNGPYLRFNPDGSKLHESTYKNDELNGNEKKYDKTGKLISSTNYIDGFGHGKATITDPSSPKGTKDLWFHYGSLQ